MSKERSRSLGSFASSRCLAKADVNARDQNNMTPLMGCVVGGLVTKRKAPFGFVKLLLEVTTAVLSHYSWRRSCSLDRHLCRRGQV